MLFAALTIYVPNVQTGLATFEFVVFVIIQGLFVKTVVGDLPHFLLSLHEKVLSDESSEEISREKSRCVKFGVVKLSFLRFQRILIQIKKKIPCVLGKIRFEFPPRIFAREKMEELYLISSIKVKLQSLVTFFFIKVASEIWRKQILNQT